MLGKQSCNRCFKENAPERVKKKIKQQNLEDLEK
jgi:hypothetical protein